MWQGGGCYHLVPNKYMPAIRAANHKLAPWTVEGHLHHEATAARQNHRIELG